MKRYGIGVDVGGTTTILGLFDEDGTLCEKHVIATNRAKNGREVLPEIGREVQRMCREADLVVDDLMGVGIGVPGPVLADGTVKKCVNLGWGYRNIKTDLQGLLGCPVFVTNDANGAALGEVWMGAAKGFHSTFMVTIGTGIGGGLVHHEKVMYGFFGGAGEIGHVPVNPFETEVCSCGKCGCVEQYCSATGILRLANQQYPGTFSSAQEIYDLAKEGDAWALELTRQAADYLGRALAIVSGVVDPEVFVLGGGVSEAGEFLLQQTQEAFRKHAFHVSRDAKFVLAKLGNEAGMYGAMKLVLNGNTKA